MGVKLADNPGDVLSLGVDPDESAFRELDQLVAHAGASFDTLRQKVDDLSSSASKINSVTDALRALQETSEQTAIRAGQTELSNAQQRLQNYQTELDFLDRVRAAKQASTNADTQSTEFLSTMLDEIKDDTAALDAFDVELNKVAQDFTSGTAGLSGLTGRTGGFLGDTLGGGGNVIPPDDGSGGGAGGISGGYGITRGFQAASQLARQAGDPGLAAGIQVSGELLRTELALQRIGAILPKINEAFEATPNVLTPVVGGLTDLGIPITTLGVVAPLAIAATAGVAIEFNAVKAALDPLNTALEIGVADLKAYDVASTSGKTASQIALEAAKSTDALAGSQKSLTDQTNITTGVFDQLKAQSLQGQGAFGIIGGIPGIEQLNQLSGGDLGARIGYLFSGVLVPELGKVQTETDKLKTTVDDTIGSLAGLTSAAQSLGVIANTAADDARKRADADIKQSQQFAADDNLSRDAAQARITMLNNDIAAQLKANATIEESNKNVNLSAEQHQLNAQAIQQHTAILADDLGEVNHLTLISLPLIQARQDEASAISAQTTALQEHTSFITAATKLDQTGTAAQVQSERDTLIGKLTTAQNTVGQLQGQGPLNDADTKKLADAQAAVKQITSDLKELDQVVTPVVNARVALQDAAKAAEAYGKTYKAVQEQVAQQEQQYTQGSLQDVEQRNAIRLRESRAETALTEQTANAITDIRTKLGQDETRIDTNYNRQIQDDQTKFRDVIAADVRNAQQTAETDQQSHLQKLADISTQYKDSEFSDLLNRNFLQLAIDQRKKTTADMTENQSYTTREQTLQRHLQQQETDQAIALTQLEEQQRVARERQFQDADIAATNAISQQNINEDRKRQALITSENQQLQDLTNSEIYHIQILQAAAKNRVQLAFDTETAIVAASISAFNKAITSFLYPSAGGSSGNAIHIGPITIGGNSTNAGNVVGAGGINLETVLRNFFGG